jgi:hypothetical protein
MTLTSTLIKDQFNGTGAQTAFPTSFVFWDSDDLQVIHTDAADLETTWVRGTQYTVTGGSGTTGTVNVSTSPTDYTPVSGTRLTIRSALPNTQPTSLPAGGPFPSTSVEQSFDQNVRLIQQLAEEVTRTVQLPVTSTNSGIVTPEPEATKFLRWDSAADNLENADITGQGSIGLPVVIAEGGTNAITAAGARTNLDFTKGADIVSATALALGTDGNYFDITGTTTITSIGTWNVGDIVRLHFDGVLTLTHHATNLVLPGGQDIKTAAGDEFTFIEYAAGTWRCLNYQPATGTILRGQGTDIASASPLVLTDVATDGSYFDVTGTTGFSAMTVPAGMFFMLQFDGALTLTHGASLDLPSEANITTAAGDRAICFATAADTVQVLSYFKADGKAVVETPVPTGLTEIVASTALPAAATLDISSIAQTYSALVLVVTGASCDTATRTLRVQLGNTTLDTTAGNYMGNVIHFGSSSVNGAATVFGVGGSSSAAQTTSCSIVLTGYQANTYTTAISSGQAAGPVGTSGNITHLSTAAIDIIGLLWSGSGDFDAGTYALYGVD